jgi:hypothetical protein
VQITLNAKFASFLRKMHLKGIINEVAIDFYKEGHAHCQAVDITNTVFIDAEVEVGTTEDTSLGLGPLSMLCKYVEGAETTVAVKDNWVVFRKGSKGTVKILSMKPELIPTRPAQSVDITQFDADPAVEIQLEAGAVDNFFDHQSLVGGPSVVLSVEKGRVFLQSPHQAAQQFKVAFGKAPASVAAFSVELYSDFFVAVLREIDWAGQASLKASPEFPVVITQDTVLWAITPVIA